MSVNGSVNLFDTTKTLIKTFFSFKGQVTIFLSLIILFLFKCFFQHDFSEIFALIASYIPSAFTGVISKLVIPILHLLFFIGLLGMIVFLLYAIFITIGDKTNLLDRFDKNTSYKAYGGIRQTILKVISFPINFALIIIMYGYIFNIKQITSYWSCVIQNNHAYELFITLIYTMFLVFGCITLFFNEE